MTGKKKIEFFPDGPFYYMVQGYKVGISGLLLLLHNVKVDLKELSIHLKSTEVPGLEIYPHEQRAQYERGDFTFLSITQSLTRSLVNWAYEHAMDAYPESTWLQLRKTHPEIEFLRHLRNASSHREGRWKFRDNEPSRPAEWRGRKLTSSLNGMPIWNANLEPGDILLLLSDVEQLLRNNPPLDGW